MSGPVSFLRRFSYKDIKRATDGFRRISYSNSYGVAYKAIFKDGLVALVKEVREFDRGKDFFYGEVQRLGRLHHRHLLQLRGFSTGHKRSVSSLLPVADMPVCVAILPSHESIIKNKFSQKAPLYQDILINV